jgi:hypothetical protein
MRSRIVRFMTLFAVVFVIITFFLMTPSASWAYQANNNEGGGSNTDGADGGSVKEHVERIFEDAGTGIIKGTGYGIVTGAVGGAYTGGPAGAVVGAAVGGVGGAAGGMVSEPIDGCLSGCHNPVKRHTGRNDRD